MLAHLACWLGIHSYAHSETTSPVLVWRRLQSHPHPQGAPVKIFGREPAAIVGAIQALLALAISFGWLAGLGLTTQDDLALVMAVVSGVAALYLAYVTSETLLAPVVEVSKAALALGTIYGFHLTTEQTGFAIAAITALISGWQRGQVSPLTRPSFNVIAPDDTVTSKMGPIYSDVHISNL